MQDNLFRLYDKSQERMIYSSDCDEEYQGKREWMPFMFSIGFSHYNTSDFSEIMPFIGKLDINDNKIFVGDIIKDGDTYGKVIYDKYSCAFVIEKKNGKSWFTIPRDIEILGNIYENSELTEKLL